MEPFERANESQLEPARDAEREADARFYAMIIYILLGAGLFAFLPWIAAAIVYYVKREDVAGTLYESHFEWQIRTFWFSLLWDSLAAILIVATFGIGLIIAWPAFAIVHIWVLYRIIKGIIRFSENRTIPHQG
jgi:uncharacterized membrane protein